MQLQFTIRPSCECGCGEMPGKRARFVPLHRQRMRISLPDRFWRLVDCTTTPDGCWPWLGYRDKEGYGQVQFWNQKPQSKLAHRVAYELQRGNIPAGMDVLHTCDYPACCRGIHFFLGNQTSNNKDRDAKGRQARGESHPSAKLTTEQAVAIRQIYEPRLLKSMMAEYGVGTTTIRNIVAGKTWSHITGNHENGPNQSVTVMSEVEA